MRAVFGMKPPDGAFNANPGAPTNNRAVFPPIGRARWNPHVTCRRDPLHFLAHS